MFDYQIKCSMSNKSVLQMFYQYTNICLKIPIHESKFHSSISKTFSMCEAKKYYNEDFKNLYRYIKTLSLLNSLYLSQAISQKQFEEEQSQIQGRYNNIVNLLKNQDKNVDFERFAQLYGIQTDFKRIKSQPKNQSDKKISQVVMMLTSKIIQVNDIIHLIRSVPEKNQVKHIVNVLCQMDMLLKKFNECCKKVSPNFLECMNKFSQLSQKIQKMSIHKDLSPMQLYDLQDLIAKLKLHLEQHLSS